jgi:hypothetical protein
MPHVRHAMVGQGDRSTGEVGGWRGALWQPSRRDRHRPGGVQEDGTQHSYMLQAGNQSTCRRPLTHTLTHSRYK